MSRRKQSKPRALKRELGEDEDEENHVTSPSLHEECAESVVSGEHDGQQLSPCMLDEDEDVGGDLGNNPPPASPEHAPTPSMDTVAMVKEDGDDESYRCETCGAVFGSLTQFMDHRNYACARDQNSSWHVPSNGGNRTPSLVDPVESPPTADVDLEDMPSRDEPDDDHPFQCNVCHKAFQRMTDLRKHEQVHSDQLPYRCHHCSRIFKTRRKRDRHARQHSQHPGMDLSRDSGRDPRLVCPECNAAYPNIAALTFHMSTHSQTSQSSTNQKMAGQELVTSRLSALSPLSSTSSVLYQKPSDAAVQCMLCGEMCEGREGLSAHMELHDRVNRGGTPAAENPLQCPLCGQICMGQASLLAHTEQKHVVDKYIKCPSCGARYINIQDLYVHMKTHHGAMPMSTEEIHSALQGVATDGPSRDCPDNLNLSGSASSLPMMTLPEKTMGDDPKLDCPYCTRKGFSSVGMLNVHMRTMHTGVSNHLFPCHLCQTAFSTQARLEDHIKKEHSDAMPHKDQLEIKFPCDYCPVEFTCAETLKHHKENVHKVSEMAPKAVEVVYCSQCTMGFPHIYALAEHMHNIHGYNKSKQQLSPSRKSASSSPEKSTLHVISPEGLSLQPYRDEQKMSAMSLDSGGESYQCDHCSASLMDLQTFQIHLKNCHVDMTRYSCPECQACFTNEEQLESHIFFHFLALTVEYGCTSCLKLFPKPDELQKHLMDIHAHHLYRCALCKEIFDSKVNVQVHFAIKHSNECKLYKCMSCATVFRSEMEWQLHVKVQHLGVSKPYRCFFCKDSFGTEAEHQTHLASHQKAYTCPLCDEAFHVEYLLDKHMQTVHSSPSDTTPTKMKIEPSQDGSQGLDYTSNGPLSKSMCRSPNTSPMKPRSPRPPSVSIQTSPPAAIHSCTPPLMKKGELNYKCEICDVKFCDEGSLQNHRVHDHSISPELHLIMQKSQQAVANQVASSSPKPHHASDKFSQLCVYCNQTFKTKSELEKHMKTHVTPSNQKCNICDEIFPSASILAEHKLTHCKVVKGNVCVVCKVAVKNEEQFYTHSQQHGFQGTSMQCVVCRQTLASMLELQMHARHHFQTANNLYTCCVCLKSFDTKENLVSKLNTSGRSYYVCKPCYHGEAGEIRCPTCGVVLANQLQLEAHLLQHRSGSSTSNRTFQCIKCQQAFASEYEIQAHVATHVLAEGNVHTCHMCQLSFESPAKLQCHLIDHTFEGQDIQCYVCSATFKQATEIQLHALEHGMSARQYACPLCPQKFFFSAELQNHMCCHSMQSLAGGTPSLSGTPSSKSPSSKYLCQQCSKSFVNQAALSSHMKAHEKKESSLIKCSLCPDSFVGIVELQQHFFSAHSTSLGDTSPENTPTHENRVHTKKYTCPHCGKVFDILSAYQGHLRSHGCGAGPSPVRHLCVECGKDFASARNLKLHKRSHTGEKPYQCPICEKRFTRKENQKSHMKLHRSLAAPSPGNKSTHECPICSKPFTKKHLLHEHIRIHLTQSNMYSCDTCGESFSHRRHLRRHSILVHNKTPEYPCSMCSTVFTASHDLRIHLQQSHLVGDDLLEVMSTGSSETNMEIDDIDCKMEMQCKQETATNGYNYSSVHSGKSYSDLVNGDGEYEEKINGKLASESVLNGVGTPDRVSVG